MKPGFAEAKTELTDERCGGEIPLTGVACPACGKDGTTKSEVNMCGGCGEWFRVIRR